MAVAVAVAVAVWWWCGGSGGGSGGCGGRGGSSTSSTAALLQPLLLLTTTILLLLRRWVQLELAQSKSNLPFDILLLWFVGSCWSALQVRQPDPVHLAYHDCSGYRYSSS